MIRPGSSLARSKPKKAPAATTAPAAKVQPEQPELKLETFLERHDYTGAITLLNFERKINKQRPDGQMWLAYCLVHNGEYDKASAIYSELITEEEYKEEPNKKVIQQLWLYKAVCSYGMREFEQANEEAAKSGPPNMLQNRLLFHVALKLDDEPRVVELLRRLNGASRLADTLCVAALQYLRLRFAEAITEYKNLLEENLDMMALHVYVALCYYKLDYHELADDILKEYVKEYPGSLTAVNLKACCLFHLNEKGGAAAAEEVLLDLERIAKADGVTVGGSGSVIDNNDLLRHNLSFFRGCPDALQVLTPLIDVLPEARHNLVIHYLRDGKYKEAYELIKESNPIIAPDFVLKGATYMAYGNEKGSKDMLREAHELFKTVGMSESARDTIQGRQAMAACFFLNKQFNEVLLYLRSIKDYFNDDDTFNWNFGTSLANNKEYKEAAQAFLNIKDPVIKRDSRMLAWLLRSLIRSNQPDRAWGVLEDAMTASGEENVPELQLTAVYDLLRVMADDFYTMGHFKWALRAIEQLESIQGSSNSAEFFDAKKGAVAGVFQQVIAGEATESDLYEALQTLDAERNPQCKYMVNVIHKWADENGYNVRAY